MLIDRSYTVGVHAAIFLEHGADFSQSADGTFEVTANGGPMLYDPSGALHESAADGRNPDPRGIPTTTDESPLFERHETLGVVYGPSGPELMAEYDKFTIGVGYATERYYFNTTPDEELLIAVAIGRVRDPRGLECASSVSKVLRTSGVTRFGTVGETSLPGVLADDLYLLLPQRQSFASSIAQSLVAGASYRNPIFLP